MPTKKYQNEGGPTAASVVELLRTYSTDRESDVDTFVGALCFNWLIAGTDAHAKNYSLLLANGPTVRLAPLYDVASVLPYDEFDLHQIKLAMKIGGEYKLSKIGLRQWQKFAREMRIDADEVTAELDFMIEYVPDDVNAARTHARQEGLKNQVIDRLVERLIERVNHCKRLLAITNDDER